MRAALLPCLAALLACATPARPLMAGQHLSSLSLDRLEGATPLLQELEGQVVLLDIWASWCAPCVESLPFYAELEEELGPRGFRVLGLNVDADRGLAQRYLQQSGVEMRTLWDPGAHLVESRFEVRRLPLALLIDRQGEIHTAFEGFVSTDKEAIRRAVEKLLAR